MPRSARPRPRATGIPESQVTAAVLDAAALFGLKLERRNVGMAAGANGKAVRFGTPGEPDYSGVWPAGPNRGRTVALEIKRGDFDPTRLRGAKAAHFARQVAAMRRLNDSGGFALWLRDGADAARVFARLMGTPGLAVEIDGEGWCWLVDGE